MSIPSHKSSPKKARTVHAPQRANGKLRVAAILEAAAAVIAEKGYEAATMAEIADRSGTKIGSLYRFFPNKESLADTIVVSARENLDVVFDKFDAKVNALSVQALADDLPALLFEQVLNKPALRKLLDADQDWSVEREEFRSAALARRQNAYDPQPKPAKEVRWGHSPRNSAQHEGDGNAQGIAREHPGRVSRHDPALSTKQVRIINPLAFCVESF